MPATSLLTHPVAPPLADLQARNERFARWGRVLLWFLVVNTAMSGIVLHYLLPQDLYLELVRLLAGDYAEQEAVLGQRPWIDVVHRVLGLTLLVAGMLQFDAVLRRARPRLHRWSGRVFLALVFVVGATALIIALAFPFAGFHESIFVCAVCILLLWFATMALSEVRRSHYAQHREWMIRTFGLCFFIAVQRLYWPPMTLLTDSPDPVNFMAANWLATITVLIAAESWINLTRNVPTRSPA